MINNIQPRLGILFDKLGYIACRSIHVSLVLAFIIIITALTYLGLGFIFTISLLPVKLIYLTMGLWIIYNIIFNYVMATLVSPGNPTAVVPLQLLRKIDQRCKKCYTIKPPRSHHCSMCNSCVLQMDHHCPWLGTCIGHHNRRFFINFLTYITLGLAYFMFLCWETGNFYRRLDMIAFSGSLFICLFLFGGFHWIIMLRGQTTLEVCFGDPKYKPSKNMMDNFQIVYGTKNCCLAFLPSNRILPYSNYEWSRALINCDDNENNLLANRGHEIAT